jgi:HicB family
MLANRRIEVGTISLKLSDSLHKMARELAKQENISINQLITLSLAEKISALMAEEYLGRRAKLGNRGKFMAALAKVADVKSKKRNTITKTRKSENTKKR